MSLLNKPFYMITKILRLSLPYDQEKYYKT